jgi:hypothetical protein
VNNLEQVWREAPYTAGTWSFRVAGASVPQGPQGYSLVITPGAGFEPFGPDLPTSGASFEPDDAPASFTWNPGMMTSFKVQWSSSASFESVKSSGDAWLTSTSFTPSDALWVKILKLGTGGTVTWRVIGKDDAGNKTNSASQSFLVTPARPASFTGPADGAGFLMSDPPPAFTWAAEGNSSFKITFSASSTLGKPHKTSGDAWLTGTSWTPSQTLWERILDLAADSADGRTVYYQITSKDQLGRKIAGPARTIVVNP